MRSISSLIRRRNCLGSLFNFQKTIVNTGWSILQGGLIMPCPGVNQDCWLLECPWQFELCRHVKLQSDLFYFVAENLVL
jgi:hypothetical protein